MIAILGKDIVELAKSYRRYPSTIECLPTIWLLTAPAAIVTTNCLVRDKHQHFPYHILVLQLLLALAIRLVFLFRKHGWDTTQEILPSRFDLRSLRSRYQQWRIAYYVFAVLTLLSSYQAFFHLPSLFCLTMVLVLAPTAASLLCTLALHPDRYAATRAALITACVFTIFWNDYRLTPNGTSIALLAIGSYIATNFAQVMVQAYEDVSEQGIQDSRDELPKFLLVAMLPLLICTIHAETPNSQGFDFTAAPLLFIGNAIVGGVALASGGGLFATVPSRQRSPKSTAGDSVDAPVVLALVFVCYALTGRDTVVSVWQISAFVVAYIVAITATVDFDTMVLSIDSARSYAQRLTTGRDFKDSEELEGFEMLEVQQENVFETAHVHRSSIWRILRTITIIVAGLGWILLSRSVVDHGMVASGYERTSKMTLKPGPFGPGNLDIVVSYHDEQLGPLLDNINAIRHLPNVAPLDVRVIMYAKDSLTPVDELQSALMAGSQDVSEVVVTALPNVGREGETFLTHILNRWDDLADHTLFVQAEMHNPWYTKTRIEQYFVPSTGFLSLWHMETLCENSATCRDVSNWGDEPAVLDEVCALVSQEGEDCRDLVLTFRGQFIASAARIKANSKSVYANLQQRFWTAYRETQNENPLWGYTLERLWGAVMQCPGGKRLADRCPSLASGLVGTVGAVDDCQCVDTP